MRTLKLALGITALLAAQHQAFATNWFELQNNEQPGAAPYTVWGFIQPQYVHNEGGAVNGIAAPAGAKAYNGQTALFNLVGPDVTHRDQLQIFRARGGVRGVIPGTGEKINYFVLGEVGNNGLTRERHAVLTDASVTFNQIPGARVRVGLGRLPLGEEAMQGVQIMDYINFTGVTDGLLNERQVAPYSTTRPTLPTLGVPFKISKISGAIAGYRDVGVEIYDWFRKDQWEYAYALMVSQGNGIGFDNTLNRGNHDVTGRLQASYVFGGKGPKREDATAYIWRQEGDRAFNGTDYARTREGVGAKYLRNGLRLSGEYIRGRGMIYVSPQPQFNDVGGSVAFEPVNMVAVESSNKASGYYLDMGWRFNQKWEADLRYDEFSKLTNSAFDERKTTTWTLGAQYFFSPALRFQVNYEIRNAKVVDPNAAGLSGTATQQHTQLSNNTTTLNTMGNRLSAQLTWIF
jgi:hypothetical protein